MLKYILLAGAMTVAAPALAQTQAANGGSGSTTAAAPAQNGAGRVPLGDNSASAAPQSATAPTQALPAPTAPAQTAPAQTAPADAQGTATAAQTTDAPATPGQPVNKADQVAQVVNAEFPGYDKDGNGALSATEFGAWMVALRAASDPKAKAEDPATKTWVTQAFAQADKDKSKSVSKAELQGFLSQAG